MQRAMGASLVLLRTKNHGHTCRQAECTVPDLSRAGGVAACRQRRLIHRHGTCGRLRTHLVYIDGQGRCRQITIAVFDAVDKSIGAAVHVRIGFVSVAAVSIQRQRAQRAHDLGTHPNQYGISSVIARFDTHHATAGVFAVGAKLVVQFHASGTGGGDCATRVDGACIRMRGRHIVNNSDLQCPGGIVAVFVAYPDCKIVRGGVARRFCRQRVAVVHESISSYWTVAKPGYRQRTKSTGNDLGRSRNRHVDCHTVKRQGAQPVNGFEAKAASDGIATVPCVTARRRQASFVNQRGWHIGHRLACGSNVDGQVGRRGVTVAVSQGVAEGIGHAARRTRCAGVAISAIRIDGEHAVLAVDG